MKKLKGCLAENIAVCQFQLKGLYVFKACQTHGPVDLITVDPRDLSITCYDIKTRSYRRNGSPISRLPRTKKGDIRIAYIEGDKLIIPEKRKK